MDFVPDSLAEKRRKRKFHRNPYDEMTKRDKQES